MAPPVVFSFCSPQYRAKLIRILFARTYIVPLPCRAPPHVGGAAAAGPPVAVRGAVLLPDLPDAAAAARDGGALRAGAGLPHQAVRGHRRQPRRQAGPQGAPGISGRRALALPAGARRRQGHVAQEPHGGGAALQMGCKLAQKKISTGLYDESFIRF